jgi:hypothetical protein
LGEVWKKEFVFVTTGGQMTNNKVTLFILDWSGDTTTAHSTD